jgi:hypothetical protein
MPPDELQKRIIEAAIELRDAADLICGSLDDSDDFVKLLSPKIDAIDHANRALTAWAVTGLNV